MYDCSVYLGNRLIPSMSHGPARCVKSPFNNTEPTVIGCRNFDRSHMVCRLVWDTAIQPNMFAFDSTDSKRIVSHADVEAGAILSQALQHTEFKISILSGYLIANVKDER